MSKANLEHHVTFGADKEKILRNAFNSVKHQ